nr:RNA-directed DNA polymerase, eukaryota [Tanacetum cinerariifolium]
MESLHLSFSRAVKAGIFRGIKIDSSPIFSMRTMRCLLASGRMFHRGLKQGDPLAPFLFILVMESLHLSFSRAIKARIFIGIKIDSSLTLSHLFYADDAVFIGEWSNGNLIGIMNILRCFSFLSGMSINIHKSHFLGIGVFDVSVSEAANRIGCSVMKAPFRYLGIMVGGNMSLVKEWDESIAKLKKKLSKWKLKTLLVGGRLTLLKAVLGSTPIYNMSLFKVPKQVLNSMEQMRMNFFNGMQEGERKIAWVKWSKVLASKKFVGLGVSSFFALNKVRVGNGLRTSFWNDPWIGDTLLKHLFPRLYALEVSKHVSVAKTFTVFVTVASLLCPLCDSGMEDAAHLFFRCDMAKDVMFLVRRWWDWEDRSGDGVSNGSNSVNPPKEYTN